MVGDWSTQRGCAEQADIERLQRVPSAQSLALWLAMGCDRSRKVVTLNLVTLAQAETDAGRGARKPAFPRRSCETKIPAGLEDGWRGPRRVSSPSLCVGSIRSSGLDHGGMVEWPEGRRDHGLMARKASEVRSRQNVPTAVGLNRPHALIIRDRASEAACAPKQNLTPACRRAAAL